MVIYQDLERPAFRQGLRHGVGAAQSLEIQTENQVRPRDQRLALCRIPIINQDGTVRIHPFEILRIGIGINDVGRLTHIRQQVFQPHRGTDGVAVRIVVADDDNAIGLPYRRFQIHIRLFHVFFPAQRYTGTMPSCRPRSRLLKA